MIVLHAAILNSKLLLWGEYKEDDSYQKPQRRRSSSSNPSSENFKPKLHPFSLSEDLLLNVLKDTEIANILSDGQIEKFMGWFPTEASRPIASDPILGEEISTSDHTTIAPWMVYAAQLNSEQSEQFLRFCDKRDLLKPGVLIGKDIFSLIQIQHFAYALVVRQHYLPGVIEDKDGNFSSGWEPIFIGRDQERLSQISNHFPSVCRSLTPVKQKEPPTYSAETVVKRWLASIVNSLVKMQNKNQIDVAKNGSTVSTKKNFDTMHDQWLHHLKSSTDSFLKGDSIEHNLLVQQVADWRRPLLSLAISPFRLVFRLEEPSKFENINVEDAKKKESDIQIPSSPWNMQYLLQAHDDPSLMIEINEAWNPKGLKKKVLERPGFDARHYVLSSLGLAAAICPQVEESLKSQTPVGYETDLKGAFEFLSQHSRLLEDAGFGVVVPSWWTGNKASLKATASVKSSMQGTSGKTIFELIKVDWSVALGDEKISLDELRALAKLKESLVLMKGKWVHLNHDEINKAIEFLKKQSNRETSLQDIMQMSLGISREIHGVEIKDVEATGWVDDFLSQLKNKNYMADIPTPDGFKGVLRPYQQRGFSWMSFLRKWGLGACLADDMGLGKTPQTLASIQRDWEESVDKKPVLLICPTSLTGNWKKEAEKFVPSLPVMVHHGSERYKKRDFFKKEVQKHGLVISSYSLLTKDVELFQEIEWGGVILDEAQNIKNAHAKQTQAAYSLKSNYRLALTGTPVENHVGDLWSIMHFINPGFLGTQSDFKNSYFMPIQMQGSKETAERLKSLTGPFILRRLKTDKTIISDLPEKMEMKVFCTLTKEQASLYEAVTQEATRALEGVDGIERKGVILSVLMKLKQICNHPGQFLRDNSKIDERSGKLNRLTEMLEEVVEVGDRTLIFTQFYEMGQLLKQHLQTYMGTEVLFLHGATPKKMRDQMVDRFQNDENGAKIFILSLKAGGTGLNLTRANHVFHFDRWWNPAVEDQATDRAFRIGQKKNVQVHKFVCAGTLEERIDEMIEKKKERASSVVESGEGWLTELSTKDLSELWKLRRSEL